MFSSPKVTLEAFHTVEFNYNGKQSKPHMHYTGADVTTREKNPLLSMEITTQLLFESVLINSTSMLYFGMAAYSKNLTADYSTPLKSLKVLRETTNG